jgi:outer membrane protein OmpA-like peptidoglycan-associated protein
MKPKIIIPLTLILLGGFCVIAASWLSRHITEDLSRQVKQLFYDMELPQEAVAVQGTQLLIDQETLNRTKEKAKSNNNAEPITPPTIDRTTETEPAALPDAEKAITQATATTAEPELNETTTEEQQTTEAVPKEITTAHERAVPETNELDTATTETASENNSQSEKIKPETIPPVINETVQTTADQSQDSLLQAEINRLFSHEKIEFEFESTHLTEASEILLNELVKLLNQYPAALIEIAGHSDARGNPQFNQKLSQHRAEIILEYIYKQGIERHQLTAMGYGDSKPLIADAKTPEQHQTNRRISFTHRKEN